MPRPSSPAPPRWLLAAVLAAAALAFLPSIGGEFVYDDTRQIAANPLIQDTGRVGEALTSDVWAFRADDGEVGSNYWRPTFVLWLILCHALFGLAPAGWHVLSIALHVAVTALAYGVVRRLGVGAWGAAAVALVFAVHPVHVESVAWISGSPDLLLGVGLLGATLLMMDHARHGGAWRWAAALGLAALAMGAKEVGVMTPLVVGLAVWAARTAASDAPDAAGSAAPPPWRAAVLAAAPFAVLAVGYLIARQTVIGAFSQDAPWEHGMVEAALTAPALVAFYLRQMVWPVDLGASYPLRPVGPGGLTLAAFWGPLVVTVLALGVAFWVARRSRAAAVGVALFALLLLPAFNIAAFPPEHLAHDRYLYLPLLGALIAIGALLRERGAAERRLALGAAMLAVPLLALTAANTRPWLSETALWARNIETDPTSAFAWTQHGLMLQRAGRTTEALRAFDRAIALRPMAGAVMARAEILASQGQGGSAEETLRAVIAQQPMNHGAYERLAVLLQQQGRLDEAEQVLRSGRSANPEVACAFSSNLGVVLYLQGRPDDARRALDDAADRAADEATAACRAGLFHRAQMATESGDLAAARVDFERFLDLTATFQDPATQQRRALARQVLGAGPTSP